MRERIPELATFVDRAGRLGRGMAGDAARKRELLEQPLQSVGIAGNARVALSVGSFEVGVGDHTWSAMARAAHVDRIQIAFANRTIEVDVYEIQHRRRPPVPEQPRF